MPDEKKGAALWKGRPVIHEKDNEDLDRRAAVKEFKEGKARQQAEDEAHQDYSKENHEAAASHHLAGIRAAQAVGDSEAAHKHGILYDLHARGAGYDPLQPVHPNIEKRIQMDVGKHYKFKAHRGDGLLLSHTAQIAKNQERPSANGGRDINYDTPGGSYGNDSL